MICPNCMMDLVARDEVGQPGIPNEGDLTVCAYCQNVLRLQAGDLIKVRTQELMAYSKEFRDRVREIQVGAAVVMATKYGRQN
jgi:Zn-finger nucleic acid-binding protein